MTSAKRLGLTPVATHEVVEALASVLRGGEDDPTPFAEFLDDVDGALHIHRLPLRKRDGREAAAAPLWALLWETAAARPEREGDAGLVTVRVQLQLNVDPDDHPAPERELGHAHALAYDVLQGADLGTVTAGSDSWAADTLVERSGRPTPARPDREGRLFSVAYFDVVVHAVPTPQP